MKCNPWRWLWGLIPIAMLAWLTVHLEKDQIQADLTHRSVEALRAAGIGWADANFTGRDGMVSGKADDAEAAEKVVDVVRDVWGVRIVEGRTELLDEVKSYTWSAKLDEDSVDLSGYAPNEDARRSIIGVVMANFPKLSVKDKLKLARGVPDRDVWLGGVSFALKQLSGMSHGRITLNGLDLSIQGEAMDLPSYWAIMASLSEELPTHINLVSNKITPPVIKPYVFSAKYAKSQVQLTGFLPTDPDREHIFQLSKRLFPDAGVIDRVELGGGAPAGITVAASALLDMLSNLKSGTAEIHNTDISIKGDARDEESARALAAQLRARIQKPFKLSEAIRFPKVELPPISPYVTAVAVENAGVEVSGHAPSEAARKALVTAVQTQFPGKPVADRLALGSGAPANWNACLLGGLKNLARLESGQAVISDKILKINGKTADEKLAVQVPRDVRAGASVDCESDAEVTFTGVPVMPTPETTSTVSPDDDAARRRADEDAAKAAVAVQAEAEAKAKEEAEARAKTEAEARQREAAEAWARTEAEAKAKEEAEARAETEAEARQREAAEAWARTEAEAKAKEEAEARAKAEAEAREREEAEARAKAEAEAKAKEEAEARAKAEAEARAKAEAEAREREEAETRAKAEAEAKAKEEAEARAKAEAEAAAARAAEEARRQKEREEAARCQAEITQINQPGVLHFDTASADLDERGKRALRKLADVAKDCPAASIEVEGHTDSEGTDERNQELSERRAQAVSDYLVEAGIDASRLSAVGYGSTRPVAPNTAARNMAKNRRVEFRIIAK
jgi:OOP family OmpA-OmpF porin